MMNRLSGEQFKKIYMTLYQLCRLNILTLKFSKSDISESLQARGLDLYQLIDDVK